MKNIHDERMTLPEIWHLTRIATSIVVIGLLALVCVACIVVKALARGAWSAIGYALWRRDPEPAP